MGGHRLFYISLALVAIAIASTQAIAYYVSHNSTISEPTKDVNSCPDTRASCIKVDTLINYGNTTRVWLNKTDVPANWNSFQLTANITSVTSRYYGPPLNEHFVIGINGKDGSGAYSWGLWVFCTTKAAWLYSQVGADSVRLSNGSILAWVYESDYSQPPLSGQSKTDSC